MNTAKGTINVFVQATPLNDVSGRVKYASNPEQQKEKLDLVVGERDMQFWQQLAADCDYFSKNQKVRDSIQGKELVIELPNDIEQLSEADRRELAWSIKRMIDNQTDTDCFVALHNSHPSADVTSNWHFHVIVPERQRLKEPKTLIAERNLFFDETGKRVYKKSEIMENGALKPGCSIVKKGTVLHTQHFSSKNEELSKRDWMFEIKGHTADWINEKLHPDYKRVVADDSSLFVPEIKIPHKWEPKTEEEAARKRSMENNNKIIKSYNKLIRAGVIPQEQAELNKTIIMLSPSRGREIKNIMNAMAQEKNHAHQYEDMSAAVPRTRNLDEDKELLRDLYRDSAVKWKAWREYDGDDVQEKERLRNAAVIASKRIREQQLLMGLLAKKAIEKELEDIKRRLEMLEYKRLQAKAEINQFEYSIQGLTDEIFYLHEKKKYASIRESLEIDDRIRELRKQRSELREAYMERYDELWEAYDAECKAIKAEKKAARAESREMKKTMRSAYKTASEAEYGPLAAKIAEAASRAATGAVNVQRHDIWRSERDIR